MSLLVRGMKHRPAEIATRINAQTYMAAYARGQTVSAACEEMDPTEDYPTGSTERQMDAFERVLAAAEIRTWPDLRSGTPASTWEDFTKTEASRALCHEWAARTWRKVAHQPRWESDRQFDKERATSLMTSQDYALNSALNRYTDEPGLMAKRLVPAIPIEAIVAATTPIRGQDVRSLYIADDFGNDAYRFKRVNEAARVPETTIITGERYARIHKYGRALRATYEQLMWQTLDRIAWIIGRMALQAEVDRVASALDVIINGDGNANTSALLSHLGTLDPAATLPVPTLRAWIKFRFSFGTGYTANTVLAQEASMVELMLMRVGQLNDAPFVTQNGVLGGLTPINPQLNTSVRYGITSDAPAGTLTAFDAGITLERLVAVNGEVREVEKFITNQTQLLVMTEYEGFKILDPYATRVLDLTT